jgi:proline iminopeptidase
VIDLGRVVAQAPESSLLELPKALRGFRFSIDAMWPEVSRLDLTRLAPALGVPVFFFLGRHDHWVPPVVSAAYFDALAAPAKKLVWFEASGHEPFMDEPLAFTAAMVELVRPLAVARRPATDKDVPAGRTTSEAPDASVAPHSGRAGRRASRPEEAKALVGDDVLPEARAQTTHHIDIDAPPADVWPWLVQMGRRRGGWYSWDVLDNGGRPSADRIIAALQKLEVGDILPMKEEGPGGFAVLVLDPPRALVLGDPSLLPGRPRPAAAAPKATWAFALEPIGDAATHLVVRVRVAYRPSLTAAFLRPVVGGLHAVMERKQLRTIKQRAEALGRRKQCPGGNLGGEHGARAPPAAAPWNRRSVGSARFRRS